MMKLLQSMTLGLSVTLAGGPAFAETPQFALPLDCDPGKTCFVQNFVDIDPGRGFQDYLCGGATYDTHTGTDIRVLNIKAASQGIAVRAAAAGIVAKTREGVADDLVDSEEEVRRVTHYGLGNVVIIDHGEGWQTIYGHMRKGSLKVRSGDKVAAGAPIGEVGLSGLTQFAHVHFEVRHDGKLVDPFSGREAGVACNTDVAKAIAGTLWKSEVAAALGSAESRILEVGFAGAPLTPKDLEIGLSPAQSASSASPGLVFFARVMNMHEGDQLRFVLQGPGDWGLEHAMPPVERAKATYVGFAGGKLKADLWPAGRYAGRVELYRAGRVVVTAEGEMTLPE